MCGSVFPMVFPFFLFVSSCFVFVFPLINNFLIYKRTKCGFWVVGEVGRIWKE